MLVTGAKTVDNHAIIMLTFGMDILVVIERHTDMGNLLAAEEDQISSTHLRSLDLVMKKTILLIAIAWNIIATCAIAELNKTTAINAGPTGPTPEIFHSKKL